MPIVGVTHEKDGRVRISRSVTTKVAIGLPPDASSNYPKKLDHFVFLRKAKKGNEVGWEVDQVLQEHYEANCKEFWIVFLDDDPDQVFRTEYAAFVKRGCWCRGDGQKATRRDIGADKKQWGDFKIWNKPCANEGCVDFEKGECKPSGDLYFMLADYPSLGSICRWHTSSYQSIRQVYSAIQDLRRVTGGRLMGVAAKLFVHAEKNVFEQGGATKTGTKYVVGLELRAQDLAGIQTKMLETAKVFNQIKGELSGQVLEIEEEEEERGAEIAAEFYPDGKVLQPEGPADDPKLIAQAVEVMTAAGLNAAQREARLGKYRGRIHELIEKARAANGQTKTAAPTERGTPQAPISEQKQAAAQPSPSNRAPSQASQPVENIHGLDVTDDDLPDFDFDQSPPEERAPVAQQPPVPQRTPAPKPKQHPGFKF